MRTLLWRTRDRGALVESGRNSRHERRAGEESTGESCGKIETDIYGGDHREFTV